MTMDGKTALLKLVSTAENGKVRSRDITLPASRIRGYPFRDAESSQSFHAILKLAEEAGAIQVEWCPRYEEHELKRIRLLDVRKLTEFLGVSYRPDEVNIFFSDLNRQGIPIWLDVCVGELQVAWYSGKALYGMKWQDAGLLPDVLKSVALLDSQPLNHTLDYRQFGARVLGNSKRTRQIEKPIAALFRHHWKVDSWSDRDVMQELNIVPMAHPVLLRGPISIRVENNLVEANVAPYIGLHDSCLDNIELIENPAYVLTIENLSSFNEYTQKVHDGGMILYTGGFPTKAFQRFYGRLLDNIDESVNVWHWGDTDPHGYLILKTLQKQSIIRMVKPHLMNQEQGAEYSKVALRELKRMQPINQMVDVMLDSIVIRGNGLIEQEEIEAESPLIFK